MLLELVDLFLVGRGGLARLQVCDYVCDVGDLGGVLFNDLRLLIDCVCDSRDFGLQFLNDLGIFGVLQLLLVGVPGGVGCPQVLDGRVVVVGVFLQELLVGVDLVMNS